MTRIDLFGNRVCMAMCCFGASYILAWHLLF